MSSYVVGNVVERLSYVMGNDVGMVSYIMKNVVVLSESYFM